MTREEMIEELKTLCSNYGSCYGCPLLDGSGNCKYPGLFVDMDYVKLERACKEAFGMEEPKKKDMINPDHYKVHANECIDEIRAMLTPEEFRGFLKGNFLKYRYRTGHKDDPEQEAQKSDWYMNKLMEVER